MEFEKIFKAYTVFVIAVLILTTVLCTSVVVISKFNRNLGLERATQSAFAYKMQHTSLEICTQKQCLYC